MIPLRSTERVYSRTLVTAALIALNTLIFFYQETLGPGEVDLFALATAPFAGTAVLWRQ